MSHIKNSQRWQKLLKNRWTGFNKNSYTYFIKNNNKLLILKRSEKVITTNGLCWGVNGIIQDENPANRIKIEFFEKIVTIEDEIKILKPIEKIKISLAEYENQEWRIFPCLFETKQTEIRLNWENSKFRWISVNELKNH